jgi:hypothetical protein
LTGEAIAKALGGLASLVWTGLAIYVVWLLRASLTGVVNRVTGFEGWGVKFALSGGEQALVAAFEISRPKIRNGPPRRPRRLARRPWKRSMREPKFCGSMTIRPIIATNHACCAASAP